MRGRTNPTTAGPPAGASKRIRSSNRANIRSAPASHKPARFHGTPSIASGATNQPRRDGHHRAGRALSGRTKLIDVATQIQYFVVALPRGMDVSSEAAIQTIDA